MAIYRRYRCDIWGLNYTDLGCSFLYETRGKKKRRGKRQYLKRFYRKDFYLFKSKILRFFYKRWTQFKIMKKLRSQRYVYKFVRPFPYVKQLKFNNRFHSIRLTRLYFLIYKDKQFRKLIRLTTKMDGNYERNYLIALECKIYMLLYRYNFHNNIFELLRFVKQEANIAIEQIVIRCPKVIVGVGKLVKLNARWGSFFRNTYLERLKCRTLLFPTPYFMYALMSYNAFYLMRYPQRKDLVYPFAIDIQRVTGYY